MSSVEMFREFAVVRSVFYVRSMLSEPIGQRISCVPDVYEIVFLTASSIDYVLRLTGSPIFLLYGDVLLSVTD